MGDGKCYILWGSAGHAKVLNEAIRSLGGKVVALFDNRPKASSALKGAPLIGGTAEFAAWAAGIPDYRELYGLVAIGGARGRDRLAMQKLLVQHGVRVEALLHPLAFVASDAEIGSGTQVLAMAVVAAESRVGAGCIVNHRASVDHECLIADGVHVAPGATLCGCVTVDANTMIGAGAIILPRLHIGRDVIVGAGAVVTKDVSDGLIVAGNPAIPLHSLGTLK